MNRCKILFIPYFIIFLKELSIIQLTVTSASSQCQSIVKLKVGCSIVRKSEGQYIYIYIYALAIKYRELVH